MSVRLTRVEPALFDGRAEGVPPVWARVWWWVVLGGAAAGAAVAATVFGSALPAVAGGGVAAGAAAVGAVLVDRARSRLDQGRAECAAVPSLVRYAASGPPPLIREVTDLVGLGVRPDRPDRLDRPTRCRRPRRNHHRCRCRRWLPLRAERRPGTRS